MGKGLFPSPSLSSAAALFAFPVTSRVCSNSCRVGILQNITESFGLKKTSKIIQSTLSGDPGISRLDWMGLCRARESWNHIKSSEIIKSNRGPSTTTQFPKGQQDQGCRTVFCWFWWHGLSLIHLLCRSVLLKIQETSLGRRNSLNDESIRINFN